MWYLHRISSLILLLLLLLASYSVAKQNTIIGKITYHIVNEDETLYDIARRYDLGINELVYANIGVDIWLPKVGSRLIIPSMHILPNTGQAGIIINRAEPRLYYIYKSAGMQHILTFPVSLGEEEHKTPLGITYVTSKQRGPRWFPPKSIKLEKPDLPNSIPSSSEENPLGDFAIYLAWQEILIHGTNKPWSIGAYSTYGCIRMYAEDISNLFARVKIGDSVQVIDQPIKLGWRDNKLYIQVFPNKEQKIQLELFKQRILPANFIQLKTEIINRYTDTNELLLEEALRNSQAIPININ